MLVLFGLLFGGFFLGYLIRNASELIKLTDYAITISIFLLLFFLGVSVGRNQEIIKNINFLTLQAIVLTFGAVSGSVILSFFVYKKIFKKNEK